MLTENEQLSFNIIGKEEYLYGDEELIFQIWMNLLDNAIKFSNIDGTKIIIKLPIQEEEDNKILIK